MTKKEVAAVLEEIALLLELSGENPFKSRSYTNVARSLEQHEEDIDVLVRDKRLREIKGVGDALEQKIEELVTTGKLKYHQELRKQFPESLFSLFGISGLGAKRIKTLYEELKITSLDELEAACNNGTIAGLKGFGDKMQHKILEGIAFAKKHSGLTHFHRAKAEAVRLREWIASGKGVERIEIAGSLRRCKEVVKDIDIVASSKKPELLMERFIAAEGVDRVTGKGETKSSIVLKSGLAADLRVVSDTEFPYALHHFTGSKEHNVAMRQRAKDLGLKMNEYGLFRGDALVKCKDEAAIFKALNLPFIPPELREDMGELELETTPRLVTLEDLIGVIHCHSTYSDGTATIEQMAQGARTRGYHYLALADHSQSAAYAGGLSPAAVKKQHKEIDALNSKLKGFRVIKSIESDIRADGSLDYDNDVLRAFEIVVASVHSGLSMSESEATKRVIRAVENPFTVVLGHLTGRLLLSREGYPLNMEQVVDACIANKVAIEINANPLRLDMDWRHIKRARDKGAMFSIGPDAHSVEGLDDTQYGVGIARKGWLGPEHLLNCMPAQELVKWKRSR
ncbi:MAG TPA: DNA polymerase/3'-5' exonuclease PolX [Candidatus Hydrogenedentes bacterium]|nr:DNA polymerase/3'-5' exonuclease PolX [Candidatus Hydrogenedentota bacterium]